MRSLLSIHLKTRPLPCLLIALVILAPACSSETTSPNGSEPPPVEEMSGNERDRLERTGPASNTESAREAEGEEELSQPADSEPDLTASSPDENEAVGAQVAPPPPLEGETEGEGDSPDEPPWASPTVEMTPEELDDFYLFGLSAETGTPLTQLGNTVAGVIALVVQLEVQEEELQIRVVDLETKQAVAGDEGIVESYPAEWTANGNLRISFAEPIVSLEVQLYQECTYGLTSYAIIQQPLWKDGLLTWGAIESYTSSFCWQGSVEDSVGLNVHFLRRFAANPTYVPKLKEEVPFGFFETVSLSGDNTVITRLPGATGNDGDGQVMYYITADFPKKYRPAVRGVFQDWNDVFEEEVGVRPFVVENGPEEMIPWDPRYRTIAWDGTQTLGAVAPFIDDPVTGEMFSTYVLFWLADFQSMVESYENFADNHPDTEWSDFETSDSAFGLPGQRLRDDLLERRVLRRRTFPMRRFMPGEIKAYRERLSQPLEGDELESFIIADFLSHELGHNLGLRHNFLGSADHENHANGPSSTVMDYILGMGMPGTYDRQAIRYAYGDGNWSGSFLYCTDEDIQFDPGCMPYDVGNPVSYLLGVMDRMGAQIDVNAPAQEVAQLANASEWSDFFLRLRRIMNSVYESIGPGEELVSALEEWAGRVACEEPCEVHPWLRAQWGLYMLYTQHFIEQVGWQTLPEYTGPQEELLLGLMYDLVVNDAEPFLLRAEIANKLPTANLPGAPALVSDLKAYFEEKADMSEEETELLAYLNQDE